MFENNSFDQFQRKIQMLEDKIAILTKEKSELRKSGLVLKTLMNNMEEGICLHEIVFDHNSVPIDYVIEDANPAYEKITGIKIENARGALASELYGTEESPYLKEYGQVAVSGTPYKFDTYFAPMDKHFQISVIPTGFGKFATLFSDITERKKTEESLIANQAKITSIFDAAPVGIGMVVSRVFTEVNDLVCQMTGFKRDELLGKSSLMIYPSREEYEKVGNEKYKQIDQFGTGSVETKWKHKNGQILDIILSSIPLDTNNLELGVTFTALDITKRKATEEKIRANEEFLTSIFKTVPVGIVMVEERVMTIMNDRFAEMLGYEPNELIGNSTRMLYDSDEVFAKTGKKVYGGIEEDGFSVVETILKRKDGILLDIQISSAPFQDSDKKLAITSAILDITEQKRYQESIEKEMKFSEALLESLPGIFYMYTQEGKLLRWNKTHEIISGFEAGEMLHKDVLSWVDVGDRERLIQKFGEVFEKGESRIEANLILKSGEKVPYDFVGKKFSTENSSYCIGVGLDISESVNIRNELNKHKEHLEELVDKRTIELQKYAETQNILLREVNHRVKNNLTAIIGILYKEEDKAIAEGKEKYTAALKDLIRRVESLSTVHSLLSETGWRPLLVQSLGEQLIRGVVDSLTPGKMVDIEVTESDARVNSSQAHHLTMVINELVTNTLKHTSSINQTIQIRLKIEEQEDLLVLEFSDNGPGYPAEFLKGDFSQANIGIDLINGIVKESLRGDVHFSNNNGAMIRITFINVNHKEEKENGK